MSFAHSDKLQPTEGDLESQRNSLSQPLVSPDPLLVSKKEKQYDDFRTAQSYVLRPALDYAKGWVAVHGVQLLNQKTGNVSIDNSHTRGALLGGGAYFATYVAIPVLEKLLGDSERPVSLVDLGMDTVAAAGGAVVGALLTTGDAANFPNSHENPESKQSDQDEFRMGMGFASAKALKFAMATGLTAWEEKKRSVLDVVGGVTKKINLFGLLKAPTSVNTQTLLEGDLKPEQVNTMRKTRH